MRSLMSGLALSILLACGLPAGEPLNLGLDNEAALKGVTRTLKVKCVWKVGDLGYELGEAHKITATSSIFAEMAWDLEKVEVTEPLTGAGFQVLPSDTLNLQDAESPTLIVALELYNAPGKKRLVRPVLALKQMLKNRSNQPVWSTAWVKVYPGVPESGADLEPQTRKAVRGAVQDFIGRTK